MYAVRRTVVAFLLGALIFGAPVAVATGNPTLADVLAAGNDVGGWSIVSASTDNEFGGTLALDAASPGSGGEVWIGGGYGSNQPGALVEVSGGDESGPGRVIIYTGDAYGTAGQALVSDGDAYSGALWGGVVVGAGAPSSPPAGHLPLALDTTTGDLYIWDGAAWVGPYVVAP